MFIQAGAFSVADNATRMQQTLARFGTAKISNVTINGTKFYRVRLGPVADVAHADAFVAKLKQAGITAFLVPMDSPGIQIRPIRQMSGPASFNEVFFDSVRIPDAMRIGDVNAGWKVAMATLGFERSSSGSGHRRKGGTSADLIALAQELGVSQDPVTRQRLADVYVRTRLHAAMVARVARATAAGENPGPAGSLGKLVASDNLVRIGNAASDLLGSAMVADTGAWGQFAWSEHVLGAPGYRLAGGTDEVQRNIIAERVLGLPAEYRADKAPFSQLSKN